MAFEVSGTNGLRVDQMLHGYAQGHQQLAASTQVKPRDAKAMLVLSDISGPGLRAGHSGYLTGYPLLETKMYVIARTWSAPEMPRPGCVWTHSLLIDFADLAVLQNPLPLLALFRRPQVSDADEYKSSLSVPLARASLTLDTADTAFAARLLSGLYGNSNQKIVVAFPDGADVERTVLAVWSQQWPRLRRAFRFCTLAAADRIAEANVFDLQVYPSTDRSNRARFQNAIDISEISPAPEDWIEDAVSDLVSPDRNGLRTFMRNTGGDIDAGREAFRPLCRLHVCLSAASPGPEFISEAIAVIESELSPVSARTARSLVVREAIKQQDLGDTAYRFVLSNLDLIDASALVASASAFGQGVWRRAPQHVVKMLQGSDQERQLAEATLRSLPASAALTSIESLPQLASVVLEWHPELLASSNFWSLGGAVAEAGFVELAKHEGLMQVALDAVLDADCDDLVVSGVRMFGSLQILKRLAARWASVGEQLKKQNKWLRAVADDPKSIAEFFASSSSIPFNMLVAVAHLLPPDGVPNDYGSDPWWVALGSSSHRSIPETDLYLYAYLAARAFGWRSRNQAELIKASFDPVHSALLQARLPDEAWAVLESRLPRVVPWLAWDRSLRFRDAVNDIFVDRKLPPLAYVSISNDESVFESLARSLTRHRSGRQYLRYVHRELERSTNGNGRLQLIEYLVEG